MREHTDFEGYACMKVTSEIKLVKIGSLQTISFVISGHCNMHWITMAWWQRSKEEWQVKNIIVQVTIQLVMAFFFRMTAPEASCLHCRPFLRYKHLLHWLSGNDLGLSLDDHEPKCHWGWHHLPQGHKNGMWEWLRAQEGVAMPRSICIKWPLPCCI